MMTAEHKKLKTYKKGAYLFLDDDVVEIISSGPKNTRYHILALSAGRGDLRAYEYKDATATTTVQEALPIKDLDQARTVLMVLRDFWLVCSHDGTRPYVDEPLFRRDRERFVRTLLGLDEIDYRRRDALAIAANIRKAREGDDDKSQIHYYRAVDGTPVTRDRLDAFLRDTTTARLIASQAGVDRVHYDKKQGIVSWRVPV